MNIRFYNVRILTMEEDRPVFQGELWVEGSRITYVGPSREGTVAVWDREIDGKGNLLMPGFKDAHTHSAMTFLRSFADDLPLDTWLTQRVFPAEAKLTGEDVYWLSKLAVLEYLTSGITAQFDMYMHRPDMDRAMEECGFRTVYCESINNFGGTLQEVEEEFLRYQNCGSDLLTYQLGFHAEYTTSRALMEGLAALAEKYRAPVYVHCSETLREVEDCRRRTGMTPPVYMDSLGLFRYGGGLFHGVHLEEEDYQVIKKRSLSIVTNPASNLKLASGVADVRKMLERGILVGIGTDGPASNNCLDMFREMFLVTGLQKVLHQDPQAVPALEVLRMATVNGARIMGLLDCDILAPGKRADLILINLNSPNMQPLQNMEKNLVYSGSKANVSMTMINGKILYQDGAFYVGVSPEGIYAQANRIARRILGEA